jgi:hypothetical protein
MKNERKLMLGDLVEVVEPLLANGGDKFPDIIGEIGVIVDIIADDCPMIDKGSDPLSELGGHYVLNFSCDEKDMGYPPLWFPKSALKFTTKEGGIKLDNPPKFKLKDVVSITGSTVCGGEVTTEYVGKVGMIREIDFSNFTISKDGSKKIAIPYQVILVDELMNPSPLQILLDRFTRFPEGSLKLIKSRDEFESSEELHKYIEGFATKEEG